jgi:hypothetical protein
LQVAEISQFHVIFVLAKVYAHQTTDFLCVKKLVQTFILSKDRMLGKQLQIPVTQDQM